MPKPKSERDKFVDAELKRQDDMRRKKAMHGNKQSYDPFKHLVTRVLGRQLKLPQ